MSHLLQSCVAQVVVLPRPEARGRRFELYARFFAAGEEGRPEAQLLLFLHGARWGTLAWRPGAGWETRQANAIN